MTVRVQTQRVYHMNINCSDLERSIEFYKILGFEEYLRFDEKLGDWDGAAFEAMGLPPIRDPRYKGALLRAPSPKGQTMLDLIEWIEPRYEPASLSAISLGVPRIAFWVKDLASVFQELKDLGIGGATTMLGANNQNVNNVAFLRDPDGLIVELLDLRRPEGGRP